MSSSTRRRLRFNGAAVRRLRRAQRSQWRHSATIEASTGPQSEDCGEWQKRLSTHRSRSRASTGPQSEDCGEKKLWPFKRGFTPSASTGPQSEDCGELDRVAKNELDPVASTGPQSEDCGESSSPDSRPRSMALQRGRSPKTAESGFGDGVEVRVFLASTGPQSEDCGERATAAMLHAVEQCFNGAAVRRLRRVRGIELGNVSSRVASTGPQSEDCGESLRAS